MSTGEIEKTIQFTVSLSPASGAIYDAVKGKEKFYRSKRLVHLATIGLMVEQGVYNSTTQQQVLPVRPEPKKVKADSENRAAAVAVESKPAEAHYKLPTDAAAMSALENMFDTLE